MESALLAGVKKGSAGLGDPFSQKTQLWSGGKEGRAKNTTRDN